jgi:CRP-like cAMP-binding protein
MPRFFLHLYNGLGFTPDEEGVDYEDSSEARLAAITSARSILSEEVKAGKLNLDAKIDVTDAGGKVATTVHFREVISILGGVAQWPTRNNDMTKVGQILAQHLSCFGELPEDDRQALEQLPAEVRDVSRLKDVLRDGDRPKEVVIVLSGMLHRYSIGVEGKRQVHSFYMPTEAPCLETLYVDYMDNSLGTVVDSRLGFIAHEHLYRIIDERPEARKLLWRQTLVQAAIFRTWLLRNSNLPAHASLAHLLCEIYTRAKAAGLAENDSCALPLTQEFVAEALGLTPVHVSRTLRVLRNTNSVDWRSSVLIIKDWQQLSEIARYDDRYLHLRCA